MAGSGGTAASRGRDTPGLGAVSTRFCYSFCPVIHLVTAAGSDSSSSATSATLLPAVNSCRARSCRSRYALLRQAVEQNRLLDRAAFGATSNHLPHSRQRP